MNFDYPSHTVHKVMLTVLVACLVPGTWLALRAVAATKRGTTTGDGHDGESIVCSDQAGHAGWAGLSGKCKICLLLLLSAWCVAMYLMVIMLNHEDPYAVLGVGHHATVADIKRAYRAAQRVLLKDFFPDRPGNAMLMAKLDRLQRAYADLVVDNLFAFRR